MVVLSVLPFLMRPPTFLAQAESERISANSGSATLWSRGKALVSSSISTWQPGQVSRSRGSMMKSLASASSTCPHTAPTSSSKVKVASSPSSEEKVKLSLPGWSRKVKVVSLKTRVSLFRQSKSMWTRVQEITVSSSHMSGRTTSPWSSTEERNSAEAREVKKTKK